VEKMVKIHNDPDKEKQLQGAKTGTISTHTITLCTMTAEL